MRPPTLLLLASLLTSAAAAAGPEVLGSGPEVGEEAPAFDPRHVWGPDAGSRACPMCKYGSGQGALIWVNTEDLASVAPLASHMEHVISVKGPGRIRAFVIFMNPRRRPSSEVEPLLADFARRAGLEKVAVTYVPDPSDAKSAGLYRISPDPRVRNTVIVYRKRRVFEKFVNLGGDEASLERLVRSIERAEASR